MTQEEFVKRYTYNPTNDLLGEGGFGRVYRAYDRYEHEYVALKIQSVDPHYPDLRLRNEVEKVQCHLHKNIARYKGCYTFTDYRGETDIAVMKYYESGSLDKLMASGRLSMEERCALLQEILEGIAYLHNEGIIHRDLKPQNVLIVEFGGVYSPLITDFGISKQLAEGESSAVSNSVLGGTRAYASPEQLKESTIRKNTDLWSFGVIAYQMLAGELPFNSGTFSPTSEEGRQEQFRQMMSGVLPEKLRSIPEPWQRLIRECLVVDATKRLAHAEDCLEMVNGSATYSSNSTIVYNNGPLNSDPLAETIVDIPNIVHHSPKKLYNVGDYYNENGKEGIVFEVWDNGNHGKIISLDQTTAVWDSRVKRKFFGGFAGGNSTSADCESDGEINTDKIMLRSDAQYYDAFKWCRAKGESWYLPAVGELKTICENIDTINATIENLTDITIQSMEDVSEKFEKLFRCNKLIGIYWASTEHPDDSELCAWSVTVLNGATYCNYKYYDISVRAVSAF